MRLKYFANMWVRCLIFLAIAGCNEAPSQPVPQTPQQIYTTKVAALLIKDDTLNHYFRLAGDGLEMFENAEAKQNGNVEFKLYWDEVEYFTELARALHPDSLVEVYKRKGTDKWTEQTRPAVPEIPARFQPGADSLLPLKGLRIALDPGHVGGSMAYAKKERKYVRMQAENGRPAIAFNEGNLALATAWELQSLLEAQGAEVILTRDEWGKSAFGMTYDEWLKHASDSALAYFIEKYEITGEDSTWWYEEAKEINLHRTVFKLLEFEARADKINGFHPDLTIIIHFNVDEKNEPDRAGFHQPIDKDFSMAFVPGSYMAGELDFLPWRTEFVVKLITNDIENSIDFSEIVVDQYKTYLGTPIMEWDDSLRYLRVASMKTAATGVFARNLAMNRQVVGTLCFGESIYQDNKDESLLLNQQDYEIHGHKISSRIRDVAKAYYEAVVEYVGGEAER